MGGWGDFADGYTDFYNAGIKPAVNAFEKNYNRLDNIAEAATGAATNILDFFGGKSNFLIYLGIGIVAIVVVPKILEKAI